MVTRGDGGRINWEIGIDIYTLLYIKYITNKDLLHSTGISSQYSVMTYMGKESKKEWICVYVYLIHFAVQQKLTQHCKSTILHLKIFINCCIYYTVMLQVHFITFKPQF